MESVAEKLITILMIALAALTAWSVLTPNFLFIG